METLPSSFSQQESPEIWLKSGELSRILLDSLRIPSDISIGKCNLFMSKTELDLSGFF
jgi:hypothetical protein